MLNGRDVLIYLSLIYGGDVRLIQKAIRERKRIDEEEVIKAVSALGCDCVTYMDEDYPGILREIASPPLVLYYRGDISLIKDYGRCMSIVGSREASEYGLSKTKEIASDVAKQGISVISGLARGIDTKALEGAIESGKAVAVLGNGIDYFYPAENYSLQLKIGEKGLLLSEYPPSFSPKPEHFAIRNRIIAGLSAVTIIGGSNPRSGTLITAAFAIENGRELGCLPYRADEGNYDNILIQQGAYLVQNGLDALALFPSFARESL